MDACHVLRTGIYIASSPPLGHHQFIHIFTQTPHIPLPQLVQAVTTPDAIREFVVGVKRDFCDISITCYVTTKVVYGRKPAPVVV
jgi:hypothetical protein